MLVQNVFKVHVLHGFGDIGNTSYTYRKFVLRKGILPWRSLPFFVNLLRNPMTLRKRER